MPWKAPSFIVFLRENGVEVSNFHPRRRGSRDGVLESIPKGCPLGLIDISIDENNVEHLVGKTNSNLSKDELRVTVKDFKVYRISLTYPNASGEPTSLHLVRGMKSKFSDNLIDFFATKSSF